MAGVAVTAATTNTSHAADTAAAAVALGAHGGADGVGARPAVAHFADDVVAVGDNGDDVFH